MTPSNILEHWNLIAVETIRVDDSTPSPAQRPSAEQNGPTTTSRAMAMVHIAMYDAFEQAEKRPTYYAYSDGSKLGHAAQQIAVSVAAHGVLTALYPRQSDRLDRERDSAIGQIGASAEQGAGEALGAAVAKQVSTSRTDDGSNNPHNIEYTPRHAPYDHDVDPDHSDQGFHGAHWGSVTPFGVERLIASIETTMWDMTRYRRDYKELTTGPPSRPRSRPIPPATRPSARPPGRPRPSCSACARTSSSSSRRTSSRPRTLTIEQALKENLESRVFLGVHWRMDGEEGTRNGLAIAGLIAAAFPARA